MHQLINHTCPIFGERFFHHWNGCLDKFPFPIIKKTSGHQQIRLLMTV